MQPSHNFKSEMIVSQDWKDCKILYKPVTLFLVIAYFLYSFMQSWLYLAIQMLNVRYKSQLVVHNLKLQDKFIILMGEKNQTQENAELGEVTSQF